jgi:hypothetical protein
MDATADAGQWLSVYDMPEARCDHFLAETDFFSEIDIMLGNARIGLSIAPQ